MSPSLHLVEQRLRRQLQQVVTGPGIRLVCTWLDTAVLRIYKEPIDQQRALSALVRCTLSLRNRTATTRRSARKRPVISCPSGMGHTVGLLGPGPEVSVPWRTENSVGAHELQCRECPGTRSVCSDRCQ